MPPWSRLDPGAGEPWGIRDAARARHSLADELRNTARENLGRGVALAESSEWVGQAAGALAASARAAIDEVEVLAAGWEHDARALERFAIAIDEIAAEASAVRRHESEIHAEIAHLLARLRSLGGAIDFAPSAGGMLESPIEMERSRIEIAIRERQDSLRHLESRWDTLAEYRRSADDNCVAAVSGEASRGRLAGVTTVNVAEYSSVRLLAIFAGLSWVELTTLVRARRGIVDQMWNSPPDVGAVRHWWASLSLETRASLVASIPIVIGNLNGIPFATRVNANRRNITAAIAKLNDDLNRLKRSGADPGESAAGRIRTVQRAILNFQRLRDEPETVFDPVTGQMATLIGRNVIVFDHDRDAIAEYTGVLDPVTGNVPSAVQNLGVYVPGTGTTMTGFDEEVWKGRWITHQAPTPGSIATITWKGAAFPQGIDAVSGDLARSLGERFATFLGSLSGTHSATVTGIGYSFGGSILGSAERAGAPLDRSLHVSSAGMGNGVRPVADYPATSHVPHYSLLAPNDLIVGPFQGLELGGIGHGGSPVNTPGFTRLETGYRVAGDPASGRIEGHFDVWIRGGTAMKQIRAVISGGAIEAHPESTQTALESNLRARLMFTSHAMKVPNIARQPAGAGITQ
jgi:hypothetical protein